MGGLALLAGAGWAGAHAAAPAAPPARPPVRVSQEPTPPHPAEAYAPDEEEAGSAAAIAALTTSLRFLPPPLAYLPAAPGVPSPAAVLGHMAGAAEIGRAADVHRYFRRLAAASDRVRVQAIGRSEEGREILLAMVSAGHNLAELAYFRDAAARLADPRHTPPAEAERLAGSGKLIYYLVGGTRPGEVASPEMLAELAYRLAVSKRPEAQAVRDAAVVLITPVAEPDAYDRTVEWYRRHLRQRAAATWEERREILAPPYAGHYGGALWAAAGDDALGLASTRAVAEAFFGFRPQLVQELGPSPPLLEVGGRSPESAGRGGASPDELAAGADPWPDLAAAVASALRDFGMPGVHEGAARLAPAVELARDHNASGGVIGVFGNGVPGELEREVGEIEQAAGPRAGGAPPSASAGPGATRVRTVEEGWPPGGRTPWSLRDSVNYGESATLAALAWAAAHRRELLLGAWRRGVRAMEPAGAGRPLAWIFPVRQPDPARLALLVRRLLDQRLEVHRLREALALGRVRFAVGDYLVRLDQPYRQGALRFLAGRPRSGGDDREAPIPWPLLYGVEGTAVADRAVLAAATEPVTAVAVPAGRIEGEAAPAADPGGAPATPPPGGAAAAGGGAAAGGAGHDAGVFLLRDTGQVSLLAAGMALAPYQVDAAEAAFTVAGAAYPAGSWIVQAPRWRVAAVAGRLGLTFAAAGVLPEVPRHVVHLPRLGVLHGWTDAEPSAWVRFALDRERVPYSLVGDAEVRRGGLLDRFDILVLAGADADWQRQVRGLDTRWSPLAFTRVAEFPSHGVPDGAFDVTGGLGDAGLQELRRFVAGGGVLVTLGQASALAAGTGLAAGLTLEPGPDRRGREAGDAAASRPAGAGATAEPAAELRARVLRPGHPVVYGYPGVTQVMRRGGPLLAVGAAARDRVVLRFGAGAGATPAPPAVAPGSEPAEPPAGAAPAGAAPAAEPGLEVEDIDAGKPQSAAAPPASGGGEAATPPPLPLPRPLGADDGRLVLAGRLAEGGAALDGRPAIVDLPAGKGHVVAFAFDPFDPGLGAADLRFVYNLLLNWRALPP